MKRLIVQVSTCEGIWLAECDDLGLVTEAENFEALVKRVLAVAPELAELNGVAVPGETISLEFHYPSPEVKVQAA